MISLWSLNPFVYFSLVDRVSKFLYISEQPLAKVFYFLFLFPKNIVGSYQHGTGKSPDTCSTNLGLLVSMLDRFSTILTPPNIPLGHNPTPFI